MDIEDYEKMNATIKLIGRLEEGEKAARDGEWTSLDDLEKALQI